MFSKQLAGVLALASTGIGQGASVALIENGSIANYIVPTDDSVGSTWRTRGFDYSSWQSGPLGFGYGSIVGIDGSTIQTDVGAAMGNIAPSIYMRSTFNITDPTSVTEMRLTMLIDDGFTAYLNGAPIAAMNAPTLPEWDSIATASASEGVPVDFDLTPFLGLLVDGDNVLAIHGMNRSAGSNDFLVAPTLTATIVPEPSALTLFAVPLGLCFLRRRRQQS